jgi:hypothetical protein
LAERSKALAQGASPKGRGFEPHSCQACSACALAFNTRPRTLCPRTLWHTATQGSWLRAPFANLFRPFSAPPCLPTLPPFRARPLAPSLRLPDVLRSIRRPSVCRDPFPWSADPVATKHHTPRLTASRLRSAYAVGCLIVAAVRKALAKSIRRGAEHTTSHPSPLRVARVRFLRAHVRVLAMEYTSKRALGAASFFGSVVLCDPILRIVCPLPSSRGREKATICVSTPRPFPPSFPPWRMYCLPLVCACPRLVHPNVGCNPFLVHLDPFATKHPQPAYSLRSAYVLSCLFCCDGWNTTPSTSIRSGAEHATSRSA